MLSPEQADRIWQMMVEAEVRALYFGELASQYSCRQRWIASLSFLLASGAGMTILGAGTPLWVPGVLGLAVAALQAYAIGFAVVDQASAAAKLHASWDHLSDEYERLWNRWYEPDAERVLAELQRRDVDLSVAGTTVPYKLDRLEHWGRHVYSSYPNAEAEPDAA